MRARKHIKDILFIFINKEAYIALLIHRVDLLLEKQFIIANNKLDKIFCDQYKYIIIYNYYFTENMQNISNNCNKKRLLIVLKKMFFLQLTYSNIYIKPEDFSGVCFIISIIILDIDIRASIKLFDYLEAFYKINH